MKRICVILAALLAATLAACPASAEFVRRVVPLEREGVKLFLESLESGDASVPRKPLLLVHGLTYSSHEFDVDYQDYSLARFFAEKGYAVWRLDIAGYGSSQAVEDGFLPNSDYAAEDIAAAAGVILKESGSAKLDVLGWSWGTVTSGRFAAKYPDLVRRLVLYAPIVAGLGAVEVTKPFNHNTWAHAAGDFQTRQDQSIDYDIVERAVADTFLSNCWRYDGDSSPNGGRRDLLVSDDVRLISTAQIKAPTLIIAGSVDPYVSPELCREAFETLPNKGSKLEIVEGAAHAMMMEKPWYQTFREKVLDFLKEQD